MSDIENIYMAWETYKICMDINFEYYKIFYYVAKYRNITRAADALGSSQPNVTRIMKLLEAQLGCRLFVREPRGISLTGEGEKLYAHVEEAYRHLMDAQEEISGRTPEDAGTIEIGATETALHLFLLDAMRDFKKKYPKIRIKVHNHSTPEIMKNLAAGGLDFAAATTPFEVPDGFCCETVWNFREILVGGTQYRHLGGEWNAGRGRRRRENVIVPGTGNSEEAGYSAGAGNFDGAGYSAGTGGSDGAGYSAGTGNSDEAGYSAGAGESVWKEYEEAVSFEELAGYPWIGLGRGTATYDLYKEFFREHHVEMELDMEVATSDLMIPLIQNNLGIGFVPESLARPLLMEEEHSMEKALVRIPIRCEAPMRAIQLVADRGRGKSRAADTFYKYLQELGGLKSQTQCPAAEHLPVSKKNKIFTSI